MISRADIEKAGFTKKQATAFIVIAKKNEFSCGYKVKMGRTACGAICSMAFFDLDAFIEFQRERVKVCRPNNKKIVVGLYNKLLKLKKNMPISQN